MALSMKAIALKNFCAANLIVLFEMFLNNQESFLNAIDFKEIFRRGSGNGREWKSRKLKMPNKWRMDGSKLHKNCAL